MSVRGANDAQRALLPTSYTRLSELSEKGCVASCWRDGRPRVVIIITHLVAATVIPAGIAAIVGGTAYKILALNLIGSLFALFGGVGVPMMICCHRRVAGDESNTLYGDRVSKRTLDAVRYASLLGMVLGIVGLSIAIANADAGQGFNPFHPARASDPVRL